MAGRAGGRRPVGQARVGDRLGAIMRAAPRASTTVALADPAGWPQWWPAWRPAQALHPGDAGRARQRRRLAWWAGGPFHGEIELATLEALPPERLRLRSGGVPGARQALLQGECIWLLRSDAGLTQVTHVWRLDPGTGISRWQQLAWAPLLRALHGRVMRASAVGLARHLGAAPPR